MPRPKIPDSVKKFKGTYRKSAAEDQKDRAENLRCILENFEVGALDINSEITNELVIEKYQEHINLLKHIGHEVGADNPLLDYAYKCLEKSLQFSELLDEVDIESDAYDEYMKRMIKFFGEYMRVTQEFFLPPKSRLKLCIDLQSIKESEARTQSIEESAIAKILKAKES